VPFLRPKGLITTQLLPEFPRQEADVTLVPFYIVRGPDKKCTVVETAPSATETTVTRVGKNVYVTREEADQDMAVVCK